MAIVLEGCVTARPAVQTGERPIDVSSAADRFFADLSAAGRDRQQRQPVPAADRAGASWQYCLILALTAATCLGTVLATLHLVGVLRQASRFDFDLVSVQAMLVYGLFYLLVGGNLAYQCAQYGCLRRMAGSRSEPPFAPADNPLYAGGRRPKLLVLVPSYKERPDVVRQTLISAALAEHPGRRVVLLIDDPPNAAHARLAEPAGLLASRAIPGELQALFDAAADRIDAVLNRQPRATAAVLAALYEQVADWLDGLADPAGPDAFAGHAEALFRERILRLPAREHRLHAASLRARPPGRAGIARETRRLRTLLRVGFASFERKAYVNLSHAPNKAMNLNSYIGLIGGRFEAVRRPDGLHLLARPPGAARAGCDLEVPPADYIVTVDADSLITSDYALRLVALMEQPGNARIAVAQTPYTAVPGATAPLERAAAASTDSQFFTHQGMAFLGASFWVGASALVRHAALRDIARIVDERGHAVPVFIDDRIQIEDAAATVDLLAKGWHVHHVPGRLTYSATPADFGALIIQRRRWANGGLLILPRLLRHALRRPVSPARIGEALLRASNLISAAIAGVGLPLLLLCPFDDRLVPAWMPLTVLPYYILLGWDLKRAGYRWSDVANVYALTILLIPANLAGTVLSLRQGLGGKPIPFCRTPKIQGRTRIPGPYVAACFAIPLVGLLQAGADIAAGRYTHLLYGSLIGLGAVYGIVRLVGLRASWNDLTAGRPFRATAAGWMVPRPRRAKSAPMPLGAGD